MKKIGFILVFAAFFAVSCSPFIARTGSNVANRVEIGMSVKDFKRIAGMSNIELEEMTAELTIYRIDEWSGSSENRYLRRSKFFYFDYDGLYRVASRDYDPPYRGRQTRPAGSNQNPAQSRDDWNHE
jgi:hypothetical protein